MQTFVVATLKAYKLVISPCLPSACRFSPTCSEYMLEAVRLHGVARGVWMGVKRLGRCHPFCQGGYDPVPQTSPVKL
jgi:putative membrane protein insertion efficiency factor